MSLVPKDYLTDVSIRDTKLEVKPCCSICTEEFDSNIHLPKVLKCGHTLCISCLDKAISSIQVSHYGDGGVDTSYRCQICRSSEDIPHTGASGFPNNHQLLDVIASNDSRFLTCNVCKMTGSESTFHICRECTLSEKEYDIQKIIGDEEPPLHPDGYATCSTCVLKLHNTPEHTVVEYAPIRIHYDFTRNLNSVAVLKARMLKESTDARVVLGTILDRVAQCDKEVEEMVALMKKAKSSQRLSLIFDKYTKEMTSNIKIMEFISKEGTKLNDAVTEKTNHLERGNAEIRGVHCFIEPPNMKEILKISDTIQNQPSPDENMDILDSEEAEEADTQVQSTEASEPTLRRSISQQTLPDHQQESHVIDLVSNEESIWNILGSTWETICYNINRIHQVLNHGANIRNRNNYNQEINEISPYVLAVPVFALLAIIIYMIVF
ncbi:unnamed protein product [Caenorhabditis nigoni]